MLPLVIAASLGFAGLLVATLALTRGIRIPRTVWVLGLTLLVFAAAVMAVVYWMAYQISAPEIVRRELEITPRLAASVRTDGFPISVSRGYEVGSHAGMHGDGSRMTIYRYPPAQSGALVEALKRAEPQFTWYEVPSQTFAFASLRNLVPADLLPERTSLALLEGRPAQPPIGREFLVDRERGTLYILVHEY